MQNHLILVCAFYLAFTSCGGSGSPVRTVASELGLPDARSGAVAALVMHSRNDSYVAAWDTDSDPHGLSASARLRKKALERYCSDEWGRYSVYVSDARQKTQSDPDWISANMSENAGGNCG